jgi:hypothetical protein
VIFFTCHQDEIPQELNLGLTKHALAHIEDEAKLVLLLKKKIQMGLTCPINSWCYLDDIQGCRKHLSASNNSLHSSLEGLPSVPQAKRHLGILKQAKLSNTCNCHLHDVGSSHGIWW